MLINSEVLRSPACEEIDLEDRSIRPFRDFISADLMLCTTVSDLQPILAWNRPFKGRDLLTEIYSDHSEGWFYIPEL